MNATTPIKSVKILGAGSIGNHMSHAASSLGWQVDLCDVSEDALARTRDSIYPGRYGAWNEAINLHLVEDAPRGVHDLIIVGTPPDYHVELAIDALAENPRAILVEKPLCGPGMDRAQELYEAVGQTSTKMFVGYDHVVGQAAEEAVAGAGGIGTIETLDVEFREHWRGIFDAHPWLDGPADSYLGYWQRGGGAGGEHSHATNLWQAFAHAIGAGRVTRVSATMDYVSDGPTEYDKLCLMTLETESGLIGRVVQDVVTEPPRKWARLQGVDGFVEWHCGFEPGCDAVIVKQNGNDPELHRTQKTRPDDFIRELRHIEDALDSNTASPISLERGLDTMLVIAAAHESARSGRTVDIDPTAGYTLSALTSTLR